MKITWIPFSLCLSIVFAVTLDAQAQPRRGGGVGGPNVGARAGGGHHPTGGSVRYASPQARATPQQFQQAGQQAADRMGSVRYSSGYAHTGPYYGGRLAVQDGQPAWWTPAGRSYNALYTLPAGYQTYYAGGVPYYYSGGNYYQSVYYQGQPVYIQVPPDEINVPKNPPAADQPQPEKPEPADPEQTAAAILKLTKGLIDDGKTEDAKEVLARIVAKYPGTKGAAEAEKLLKELK